MIQSKILIIDDDESILKTFSAVLGNHGYIVHTADDYDSAMAAISQTHFDVIFADIILEERSGIDILKEAKTLSGQLALLPVLGDVGARRSGRRHVDTHPVHPLACRPGSSDEPEGLQRVDRAGDRASACQQGVSQLRDALLPWVADPQVPDQPAHHRSHPVASGVEAPGVVGVRELFVTWHADYSTQPPEITQSRVISGGTTRPQSPSQQAPHASGSAASRAHRTTRVEALTRHAKWAFRANSKSIGAPVVRPLAVFGVPVLRMPERHFTVAWFMG